MLEKHLKEYFGFAQFRPGQKEIIESILEGKDVVALMPTGGGKSLCYQLPAILSDELTLVISPLIALMKDQVDSLTARGIPATFINGSLSSIEMAKRMEAVKKGKVKLLYIAPERLAVSHSREFFSKLKVSLLAVDEAHCVSQWGHDFRPDYLAIGNYLEQLESRPTIAAFTATATCEVKDDIINRLNLKSPQVFVRGFDRSSLKFFVQRSMKPKERLMEVLRLVRSIEGSGIVYALSRKDTELIAHFLQENGIKAVAYHAKMSGDDRAKIQNDFMENRFKTIVATIAFGMGVDKADIRFVIHAGMPASLEGYYQEAGRAGRDGEVAYCVLLHSKKDTATHQYFIRGDQKLMRDQGKDWQEIKYLTDIKYNRLQRMVDYVTKPDCRRKIILEYFDDPERDKKSNNCKGCDVCLDWKPNKVAVSGTAQKSVKKKSLLGSTVMLTAKFYRQGFSPVKIAKIRSLGVSTIFTHLTQWYLSGGQLDVDKLVPLAKQQQIKLAISKNKGSYQLKPLKEMLPKEISYEDIKLVIAKMQLSLKNKSSD